MPFSTLTESLISSWASLWSTAPVSAILIAGMIVATCYLGVTSLILLRNYRHFRPLGDPDALWKPAGGALSTTAGASQATVPPLFSICIPARNEQDRIKPLLDSLSKITASDVEVLFLDDASTDDTLAILKKFAERASLPTRILQGEERPSGWLGKPWACHQLAEHATGAHLVFLDADVVLSPAFFTNLRTRIHKEPIDLLTLWPIQTLGTVWEKAVIPLVYYALLTLLPVVYQRRSPRWMPASVYGRVKHIFAAACGQCIVISRACYDAVDGHRGVRMAIVEDVVLAKRVRRAGFAIQMASGHSAVHCRMYTSNSEMFSGFRKNFFEGFDRNVISFVLMGLLHLIVFLLPMVTLVMGIVQSSHLLLLASLLPIGLIAVSRMALNAWMGWPVWTAALHPLGVLWFQWLSIRIGLDHLFGRRAMWKDRPLT